MIRRAALGLAICIGSAVLAGQVRAEGDHDCRDPRSYGASIDGLKACRRAPEYHHLVCAEDLETPADDDRSGATPQQIREAMAAYCRLFKDRLTAAARDPASAVGGAMDMVARMAWSIVPDPEAQNDLWSRQGLVGAAMGDAAFGSFSAMRHDGTGLKSRWADVALQGRLVVAQSAGADVDLVDPEHWRLKTVETLFEIKSAGGAIAMPGRVVIEASGAFDPDYATDVNPLGLIVESWNEQVEK